MAKKVVQLYDKYKSTTKVFPKIIEECFEPSAKEYIEGQVVANPTPAGDETTLAYLEIGGTKYAIPVPTTVVANPELAGTEAELGSIQIGDTKYKIGGGKQLYQHNIYIYHIESNYNNNAMINIICDSNEAFTFATLKAWLKTNGYASPLSNWASDKKWYSMFGMSQDGSSSYFSLIGILSLTDYDEMCFIVLNNNNILDRVNYYENKTHIIDTIRAL